MNKPRIEMFKTGKAALARSVPWAFAIGFGVAALVFFDHFPEVPLLAGGGMEGLAAVIFLAMLATEIVIRYLIAVGRNRQTAWDEVLSQPGQLPRTATKLPDAPVRAAADRRCPQVVPGLSVGNRK